MKPYYRDEKANITIYHGDCNEILPELEPVDLVVTDPPYGMNWLSGRIWRKEAWGKIKGDKALPVETILAAIEKAKNAAFVFCRWDNFGQLPEPKSVIVWAKNNWTLGDLEHEYGRMWEACLFYPKEGHRFIKRPHDVIQCAKTGNKHHPTEKPVQLIGEILEANVGESVLDPFVGSGTTLLAAKELKRGAIGIEIEERYCETAANRLRTQFLF